MLFRFKMLALGVVRDKSYWACPGRGPLDLSEGGGVTFTSKKALLYRIEKLISGMYFVVCVSCQGGTFCNSNLLSYTNITTHAGWLDPTTP